MKTITSKDLPCPLEDDECKTFVHYLEVLKNRGLVMEFTHTANETFTTSNKQKARNKAMGVRSGIPDYIIVVRIMNVPVEKSYALALIEMKRQKGGTVSVTQKAWIEALLKSGVHAAVCKGHDAAKIYLDSIISGQRKL